QRRGVDDHAGQCQQHDRPERPGVTQQALVDGPDRVFAGFPGSQGQAPVAGVLVVAMERRVKPSWPSTSIAVTTDWWVEAASARKVTGRSWSSPATLSMARRSVSASCPITSLPPT